MRAARSALDGPYGDSSVAARVGMLRRAADIIERRFDDVLAMEVADTGKPHGQARVLDVARAATNFRSFADTAAAAGLPSFLTDLRGRTAGVELRLPQAARGRGGDRAVEPAAAPADLEGRAGHRLRERAVVKPSEETPGSATLLAEILDEAGVPAGVYNVVHGFGRDSAGQFLTEHPGIDGVTFTGSTATGVGIMRAVAPRVRPVSFELERVREEGTLEKFQWYCPSCTASSTRSSCRCATWSQTCPRCSQAFYADEQARTCPDCGAAAPRQGLSGQLVEPAIDVHSHYVPRGWPQLPGPDPAWLRVESEREAMIMVGSREFRRIAADCWDPAVRAGRHGRRRGRQAGGVTDPGVLRVRGAAVAEATRISTIFNDLALEICARRPTGWCRSARCRCRTPTRPARSSTVAWPRATPGWRSATTSVTAIWTTQGIVTFLQHCALGRCAGVRPPLGHARLTPAAAGGWRSG